MDFLARCDEEGVKRYFLSNNSSRSVEEYLTKLQGMGIAAERSEVLLSTHDLISYLQEAGYGKICLVGTEGMRDMMVGEGFVIDDVDPDAVVLGYDTEINYQNQIKKYFGKKIDIVLSDMAVNTTGNKNVDSLVTGELCLEAMNFALETLKTNGQFVSKIFMGSSFNDIIIKAKKNFVKVSMYKPASSRKNSKESFIICKFLR